MMMNTTPLVTYWNTAEAATVIDFLDALRDALWEAYGEQITQMHREACEVSDRYNAQCEFEFDDDITF
jgi:uncharacterized protein YktA (UPF0223 family)